MRPYTILLAALVLSATGCHAQYLRNRTLDQLATVTDLRYQQVLDNLASTAADPGTMPSFALLDKGVTQLQDAANPSGSLTFDPFGLTSEMAGLSATRTLSGEWDPSPITDPDKLKAMRCVYHRVLGIADSCGDCDTLLGSSNFNVETELAKVSPGAFGVGRKCDVPKHACRVSHCGDTYVWLNPGGLDSLTWLTITIMDIATVDPSTFGPKKMTTTDELYVYNDKGQLVKVTKNMYTQDYQPPPGASAAPQTQLKLREPRFGFPSTGLTVTPSVPSR